MSELTLRFHEYYAGTCELDVFVRNGPFSGAAHVHYFGVNQVLDFANALEAFPFPRDRRVTLSDAGEGDAKGQMRIEAYLRDRLGHFGVKVRLVGEGPHVVQVEITAAYQSIANFARELRVAINAGEGSATLRGE